MLDESALNKARDYYDTMQVLYGHKFLSQFNGQTDLHRIFAIIGGALAMLSDEQFNNGMARLNAKSGSGDFCPALADFKSWCMAGSWWTSQEAWQRACEYSKLSDAQVAQLANMKPEEFLKSKTKITTLAKSAWDSVSWLVIDGNMREAFKQFKSIYETYLAKAQASGRSQEWYKPQIALSFVKDTQPKPMFLEHTPEQKAWLEVKTAQFQSEGMNFPMALMKAMMKMKESVA